ncbi:hypothetical protein BCR42DRAFT_123898 [Absidia repens]|uniref:HAD-superfamily hydrolase n=1 Tax=Absidia repens TaxID=90262 RepID=A0A1X2I425_9FUNG|nr:hypothetical protein BCR42DRAFT_123898 [Absidia repens]
MLRRISRTSLVNSYVLTSRSYYHHHTHLHYKSLNNALDHFTKKYQEKKLKHVNAAKQDKATILSLANDPISKVVQEMAREHPNDYSHSDLPDSVYGLASTSPEDIFVNNELDLGQVQVYGFDYDYTLANYRHELSHAIYDTLKDILVDMLRYPRQIKSKIK